MQFPNYRSRRFKRLRAGRRCLKENRLHPARLVQNLIVTDRAASGSGDGLFRPLEPQEAGAAAVELAGTGVGGLLINGIVENPDEMGSAAAKRDGPLAAGIKAIRKATRERDLLIVANACVCGFVSHGHCGTIVRGELHNDESVERNAGVALSCARAGADCVLLSARLDGQVDRVREVLDEAELEHVAIASVAARFHSTLDTPTGYPLGPRKREWLAGTHLIDPANGMEAMRQVSLDTQEGADMLAVQPLLTSLDIVFRLQEEAMLPVLAIQSPGEHAMISAETGMSGEQLGLEVCVAAARAGADLIATWQAGRVAGLL